MTLHISYDHTVLIGTHMEEAFVIFNLFFFFSFFGRSVIWLQRRRDEIMERLRGAAHQRKEDQHELQIGRLKQDRVRIPRGEEVRPIKMVTASCVVNFR